MISQLTGTLVATEHQLVLLDVNGVGYEVECPINTLCELPKVGQKVTLLTHFVVREDAQLLYGFLKADDRECFRILIKIAGVGPKLAIGILSGLSGDQLARSIECEDITTLTRLPGIGKKTAERLVVELRGRLSSSGIYPELKATTALEEAVLGLIALGYKESEARKTVSSLPTDSDVTPESLIRASLRLMLKSS